MVMELPCKLSVDFDICDVFYEFRKGNPQSYPFWDNELTQLWESFLSDANKIRDIVHGNICGNKFYLFGDFGSEFPTYNTYVGGESQPYLVMNKKYLSYEQIDLVLHTMNPLVQNFVYSHTDLVNYIRYNFKDIKW